MSVYAAIAAIRALHGCCAKFLFTAERRLYIISIKKEGIMDTEKAYLSNDKDMIQFRYADKIIRFRGP